MSDIVAIALLAGGAGGAVWAAIMLGYQAWRGRAALSTKSKRKGIF